MAQSPPKRFTNARRWLRAREAEKLGMEQANVSQHLTVIRAKQLVCNRKAGNQVFYSVRDPIIIEIVSLMSTYFHVNLKEALGMLDEMEKPMETIR
jgi:DNA-binding transcriptional ArsR family regulator